MQVPNLSQYALIRQDHLPQNAKKVAGYSITDTSSVAMVIIEHDTIMEVYFIFSIGKIVTRVLQGAMLLSNIAGTNFYFNKTALPALTNNFLGMCVAEYRQRQPFITWYTNIGDELVAVEHRQACDVFEGRQFAQLENSIEDGVVAGYIPVDESYVDLLEPFEGFPVSTESIEPIIDEPDKNIWQTLYTEDKPDEPDVTQTDIE